MAKPGTHYLHCISLVQHHAVLKPGEKWPQTRHCQPEAQWCEEHGWSDWTEEVGREGHELQVVFIATQCTLKTPDSASKLRSLLMKKRRLMGWASSLGWAAQCLRMKNQDDLYSNWLSPLLLSLCIWIEEGILLQLFEECRRQLMKASSWEEMSISAWWRPCYCQESVLKYICSFLPKPSTLRQGFQCCWTDC